MIVSLGLRALSDLLKVTHRLGIIPGDMLERLQQKCC